MAKNSPYELLPESVTIYPQTEALKEAEDMSKNLVSGDFEKEYRDGMIEKGPQRKRHLCVTGLLILIAVLAGWLVVLTAVREVQIARLKQEVDELSADMIAIRFTLKSLVANKKTLTDVKPMEDTVS